MIVVIVIFRPRSGRLTAMFDPQVRSGPRRRTAEDEQGVGTKDRQPLGLGWRPETRHSTHQRGQAE